MGEGWQRCGDAGVFCQKTAKLRFIKTCSNKDARSEGNLIDYSEKEEITV